MTPQRDERITDLLDEYLDTGVMPADASADERAELELLARASGLLTSTRPAVEAEAHASMPTARARFERFVATNQPQPMAARAGVAPPKPQPKKSFFGALLAMNRLVGAGVSAAVIGLVAIVALMASQNASNRTDSAAALVLEPGDYAQVQGVVEDVSEVEGVRMVTLSSEFGELKVTLSEGTSILETGGIGDLTTLTKGQALLIAGLVAKDRTIAAQTLAFAASNPEPGAATVSDLERRPPLQFTGVLTFVAVSQEGRGRVVIATRDGRFSVLVDTRSASALFSGSSRLIGAAVTASRTQGDPAGVFVVTLATAQPEQPTTPNGFVQITGTLTAREGNLLTLQTPRGPVVVSIRTDTTILLGESGLTRGDILRGESAIGHTVTVHGGIQRITGRVIADLVAVGPKP